MHSRKLALTLAKRFRTCPPLRIRESVLHREAVDRHIALCPYCSPTSAEGLDPWEALAAGLAKRLDVPPPEPAVSKPESGELRPAKEGLGLWREDLFFNPPLVLVLECHPAVSDEILVAQTYHDVALAGPGDLILPKERSPGPECFVETWNTYSLRASYLAEPLGILPGDLLEAARRLAEDPGAYPPWAMQPRPLEENDPRQFFREMEVEVGYVFASRAAEELMPAIESPTLRLAYGSPADLQEGLREVARGLRWPRMPKSLEEILAGARFPTERLALAAADRPRKASPANLAVVAKGRIIGFEPLVLEIFLERKEAWGLAVSGRVQGGPQGKTASRFLCFLDGPAGNALSPRRLEWDEGAGFFYAEFKLEKIPAVPEIWGAVVVEEEEDCHA